MPVQDHDMRAASRLAGTSRSVDVPAVTHRRSSVAADEPAQVKRSAKCGRAVPGTVSARPRRSDRVFAFDAFMPLGIRSQGGSCCAPADRPERRPATTHTAWPAHRPGSVAAMTAPSGAVHALAAMFVRGVWTTRPHRRDRTT